MTRRLAGSALAALFLALFLAWSIPFASAEGLEAEYHELTLQSEAFQKVCQDYVKALNLAISCDSPTCLPPRDKSATLRLFRELEKIPETPGKVRERHELAIAEKDAIAKATWFLEAAPKKDEFCMLERFSSLASGLIRATKKVGLTPSERKEIRDFVARVVKSETAYPTGIRTQLVSAELMKELVEAGVYAIPKKLAAEIRAVHRETEKMRSQLAREEKTFAEDKEAITPLFADDLERVSPLREKVRAVAEKL